jgi:hypothetical protein
MISRRIFAAVALLCAIAPAHAQKTKAALTTEINANWPDNVNGAITPAVLRSTVIDIVNSYYDLNGGTSLACAAHQWVAGLPTLSSLTCTQPAFSDLSGIIAPTQIPAPTATTLGGIESIVSAAHNWISFIDTSGVPHQSQPAFSDLSGTLTCAQQPVLTGGVTTSACAATVVTNANLTGDITSVGNATTLTNAPVIAKVLTGFTSGAGTVSAADSILSALQKINGNDALKAPLASAALSGVPTAPTAAPGTNTTQIATTAMVQAAVVASTTGVASINGATGAIVGVDTSTINAQTGNYPIVATDCGKVIYASGGLNTITLPAISGFPAACNIALVNTEIYSGIGTAHAKLLSGFPSDLFNRLYPQQSLVVKITSTGWVTIYNPGRWHIPTAAQICVRQDGNDATGDGLSAGTTGCYATPQSAVNDISEHWDGGNGSCEIGLYAGGTNIIPGNVSQPGQSIGCFLTVNILGNITWTSTLSLWTGGDNSITIVNANLGFAPILAGNTSNTLHEAQFKCHQYCVFDMNFTTATTQWLPGGGASGGNDEFFYCDLQCSATFNGSINVGDGTNTYVVGAVAQCQSHCSKLTLSGTIAFNPHVTMVVALALSGGSLINTSLSWPGSTAVNPTTPTGNSVLIINGTTIPGGTIPASGFPAVNSSFGLICNTAC